MSNENEKNKDLPTRAGDKGLGRFDCDSNKFTSRSMFLKKVILTAVLATGVPTLAIGFDFGFLGSDYKKVSETTCATNGRLLSGAELIKTVDSGYALSVHTQIDAELIKITGTGQPGWRSVWEKPGFQQVAQGLSQLNNGSYLLLGRSDFPGQAEETWGDSIESHSLTRISYPLILPFNKDGGQGAYRIHSAPKGIGRAHLSRAIQVGDGVVFFGLKRVPLSEDRGGNYSPWIFKINSAGAMVWEYLIQSDGDELIKDVNEVYGSFSKPVVDGGGNIIVATQVARLREIKGVGRKGSTELAGENPRLLVVKLNSDGNEIARYRDYQSGGGILALNSNEIHVFASAGVANQSRVVHVVLSRELRVIRESGIAIGDFYPRAVVTNSRSGGFHMFGVAKDAWGGGGSATLVYVDAKGAIKSKTSLGRGTWPSDMVEGTELGEVAVIYTRSEKNSGIFFSRYKVSE
ncbi:hypothetical protein [Ralstonia flaminis]|nr:hypothetical protein [Ralstonia sp. LMG 18101]